MLKFFLLFPFLFISAYALDWQGHRGARGLYPENTIGAMEEALKYPVTTLELDVVVSQDQKVVVSHEPWFNPVICNVPSGKKLNLYKLNYDEIIKYDCGSKKHPRFPQQVKVSVGKPLLRKLIQETEATLKRLNRPDVGYSVEIKSTVEDEKAGFQPEYKAFTDLVVQELTDLLSIKKFVVQSFDWRVLRYLKEKYPEISVVALREDDYRPDQVIKDLGFVPEVFSPHYKSLKPGHIEKFHAQGIKIIPWTVNEVKDMERLIIMGVDGIITDYPNLISLVGAKTCKENANLFEGKCVKLPSHAVPSSKNPGWECKEGHQQKRSRCVKIKVPKNAHLLEDGKTWICDEGFKRYRARCVKG